MGGIRIHHRGYSQIVGKVWTIFPSCKSCRLADPAHPVKSLKENRMRRIGKPAGFAGWKIAISSLQILEGEQIEFI
jgi:hypothetical protein